MGVSYFSRSLKKEGLVNLYIRYRRNKIAITVLSGFKIDVMFWNERKGDIAFKMTHDQMNSGFLMYNMIMYFKGAKDPSFNYDMAIAAIDQQISDIKSEAAAVVAAKKVELYNINGVKISNAEPGQIVIRVTDGIAEKIVAE